MTRTAIGPKSRLRPGQGLRLSAEGAPTHALFPLPSSLCQSPAPWPRAQRGPSLRSDAPPGPRPLRFLFVF